MISGFSGLPQFRLLAIARPRAPIAYRLRQAAATARAPPVGGGAAPSPGAPRVLPATRPPELQADAMHGEDCAELVPCAQWLAGHRLNINVRQVFGDEAESDLQAAAEVPDAARKRLRDEGGGEGDYEQHRGHR